MASTLTAAHPKNALRQAETGVLRDLVDGLIAEDLFGFRSRARVGSAAGTRYLPLRAQEDHVEVAVGPDAVVFRTHRAAALQPYRLSRPPVLLLGPEGIGPVPLTPRELLGLLAAAAAPCPPPNVAEVLDGLELATTQGALMVATAAELCRALAGERPVLADWERLTALGDRPFHPTARAKQGWHHFDYRRYTSAAARPFGVDWVALRRDHLVCGLPGEPDPAERLLGAADRETLVAAASAAGVGDDEHVMLPVHPWQHRHVLPVEFAAEWQAGVCVPVVSGLGSFVATSSVRTLAPAGDSRAARLTHLKLPLAITSLGAVRLLPPRYLGNGAKAQRLLQEAAARHAGLGTRLHLCDEQAWWAFSAPGFADKPGQLGCVLRTYPPGLSGETGRRLVPLGALGVVTPDGSAPGVKRLLIDRDVDPGCPHAALELLGDVCRALTEVAMACFAQGLMPELHGQNTVLALRGGRVDGIVLRDHDTLRLHLPWLEQAGLADPGYVVKPGTPNSLVASTPAELLSWFQTLGVQVALYAVGHALMKAYGIDERKIWRELAGGLRAGAAAIGLPPAVAAMVDRHLFRAGTWPTKLLLGPLLARRGTGGGSMPSAAGTTGNPLLEADRRACELAQDATVERLLNSYLRESAATPAVDRTARGATVTIAFPLMGVSIVGPAAYLSAIGHHRYGPGFEVRPGDGTTRPLSGYGEVASLVTGELAAADPDPIEGSVRRAALCAQVEDSAAKTERYLEHCLADGDGSLLHAPDPFLAAEQGLLLGHPFHPAAKASEGFDDEDLERYAPEMRASFPLHWLAAAPHLVAEERLDDGPPLDPPEDVRRAAAARLEDGRSAWPLLPCHPWQAAHLARLPAAAELFAAGTLVALGPLGPRVHPTSSVRTVWDPGWGRLLKLPLSVRITNFVRENPPEHLRRSIDVSRVLAGLGDLEPWSGLASPSFTVLREIGYRMIVSPSEPLSAATGVVYREAPTIGRGPAAAPMVVAVLLEPAPSDGLPPLVRAVEQAGRGPAHVRAWLRRYLEISLVPLSRLLVRAGVSLEAHTQNSLVKLDGGWPGRFCVRDLEGASINGAHQRAVDGYGGLIPAGSPAFYPESEAWQRFTYYVLVNHVGQLVATLAEHLGPLEAELWDVVRHILTGQAEQHGTDPAAAPLRRLLDQRELPAKANLRSRFGQHSERPLYVGIPNPLVPGGGS